jgi:hypothetical protein
MFKQATLLSKVSNNVVWMNFNGKRFLYIDYSTAPHDQMKSVMTDGMRETERAIGSVRSIANFSNTYIDREFMAHAESFKQVMDAKCHQAILVGVTGVQNILLKCYTRLVKSPLISVHDLDEAVRKLV